MNNLFPLSDPIDTIRRKYADAPSDVQLTSEHQVFLGNSLSTRQQIGILVLCISIAAIFFGRIIQLQLIAGAEYRNLAEGNRLRTIPTPSKRGLIIDANGEILAENVPSFYLSIVPEYVPRDARARENELARIADATGIVPADIEEELANAGVNKSEPILIRQELDKKTALTAMVDLRDVKSVMIAVGAKRHYPDSSAEKSLSHLLGYEGKLTKDDLRAALAKGYLRSDLIGRTGLEASYEEALRGTYGNQKVEIDVVGNIKRIIANEAKVDGSTLRLALDLRLQRVAEKALHSQLRKSGKTRGVAIALDPKNGRIRAMVSLPSYDNNIFGSGVPKQQYETLVNDPRQPLFNRAVSGEYPSGSTLKIVYAGAALAEGVITDATKVLSTGGIRIGEWFFPDWKAGGHGVVGVRTALAWSVNTFFYMIAGGHDNFRGLGIDKMMEWAKKFGLDAKLGIDLPGERPGFFPTPEWKEEVQHEQWYIGDTYHVGIGQGSVLVTPLQVAAYTAVYANGGTLYAPTLAAFIEPSDMPPREVAPRIIRNHILPPSAVDIVRRGMREAVTYGSARSLNDLPFTVAGKTGTAQFQSNKEPHAWFTGFAPYEHPDLVVTVLIEEGVEGSVTAIPVAKEIMRAWQELESAPSAAAVQ